jgi:hypothetical protein
MTRKRNKGSSGSESDEILNPKKATKKRDPSEGTADTLNVSELLNETHAILFDSQHCEVERNNIKCKTNVNNKQLKSMASFSDIVRKSPTSTMSLKQGDNKELFKIIDDCKD